MLSAKSTASTPLATTDGLDEALAYARGALEPERDDDLEEALAFARGALPQPEVSFADLGFRHLTQADMEAVNALAGTRRGFVENIVPGATDVPFAGHGFTLKRIADEQGALARFNRGEADLDDERAVVRMMQEGSREDSFGGGVANILLGLGTTAGEFIGGAGAVTATGKAATRVGQAALKRATSAALREGSQRAIRAKIAQLAATTGLQEAAPRAMGFEGGAWTVQAVTRLLKDYEMSDEDAQAIVDGIHEVIPFLLSESDGLWHGLAAQSIENAAETSGGVLGKLPPMAQVDAVLAGVLRGLAGRRIPPTKIGEAMRGLGRVGTPATEVAEELFGQVADAVLLGDQTIGEAIEGVTEMAPEMIVALMLPGMANAGRVRLADSYERASRKKALEARGVGVGLSAAAQQVKGGSQSLDPKGGDPSAAAVAEGPDPSGDAAAPEQPQGGFPAVGSEGLDAAPVSVSQAGAALPEVDAATIAQDVATFSRAAGVSGIQARQEPQTDQERNLSQTAERTGTRLVFLDRAEGAEPIKRGVSIRPGVIMVDAQGADVAQVVYHELAHDLERRDPGGAESLYERIRAVDPEGVASAHRAAEANHGPALWPTLSETAQESETFAAYAEGLTSYLEYLATPEGKASAQRLMGEDRTLIQMIVDKLRDIASKFLPVDSAQVAQLKRLSARLGEDATVGRVQLARELQAALRAMPAAQVAEARTSGSSELAKAEIDRDALVWTPGLLIEAGALPADIDLSAPPREPVMAAGPGADVAPRALPADRPLPPATGAKRIAPLILEASRAQTRYMGNKREFLSKNKELMANVLARLPEATDTIIDLYAGGGTYGLSLAASGARPALKNVIINEVDGLRRERLELALRSGGAFMDAWSTRPVLQRLLADLRGAIEGKRSSSPAAAALAVAVGEKTGGVHARFSRYVQDLSGSDLETRVAVLAARDAMFSGRTATLDRILSNAREDADRIRAHAEAVRGAGGAITVTSVDAFSEDAVRIGRSVQSALVLLDPPYHGTATGTYSAGGAQYDMGGEGALEMNVAVARKLADRHTLVYHNSATEAVRHSLRKAFGPSMQTTEWTRARKQREVVGVFHARAASDDAGRNSGRHAERTRASDSGAGAERGVLEQTRGDGAGGLDGSAGRGSAGTRGGAQRAARRAARDVERRASQRAQVPLPGDRVQVMFKSANGATTPVYAEVLETTGSQSNARFRVRLEMGPVENKRASVNRANRRDRERVYGRDQVRLVEKRTPDPTSKRAKNRVRAERELDAGAEPRFAPASQAPAPGQGFRRETYVEFDSVPDEWYKRAWQSLRLWGQDRELTLKELMAFMRSQDRAIGEDMDVAERAEQAPGRKAEAARKLYHRFLKPMRDVQHRAKLAAEDVGEYLYARHAEEANEDLYQRYVTYRDAKAQAASLRTLINKRKAPPDAAEQLRALDARAAAAEPKLKPPIGVPREGWQAFFHEGEGVDRLSGEAGVGASGMSTSEARAILAAPEGAKRKALERIGALNDAMMSASRKMMLEAGLISQKEYDDLAARFKHYVPLRDVEAGKPPGPRTSGFSVKGKEYKKRGGRKSRAANPYIFAQVQALGVIPRAEHNRVGRAMFDLVTSHPELLESEPEPKQEGVRPGEYQFGVKVDGKALVLTLKNRDLASALQNLDAEPMGRLLKFFAGVSRTISAMNTSWDPEFLVSNFVRDIQTAGIQMKDDDIRTSFRSALRDVGPSILAMRRHFEGKKPETDIDNLARELAEEGGLAGWFVSPSFEDMAKQVTVDTADGVRYATMRAARNAGEWVENWNRGVENGIRLAVYKQLTKRGVGRQKAANVARNLTVNFNRKGRSQWLSALYMFANAGIQGNARFLRSVVGPGHARTKAIAASIVVMGAAVDALNRALAPDDEDGLNLYDKIPEHVKERNWVFWNPTGTGPQYFTLPMPYGYNVLQSLGRNVMAWTAGGKSGGDAGADLMLAAVGSFSPLPAGDDALQTVTPTAGKPFVEIAQNKTFSGSPIRPAGNPFGAAEPDSARFYEWRTRDAYEGMTRWLNEVSGGSRVEPGRLDVSPSSLQHLEDFALGGVGRFASRSWDAVREVVKMATGSPAHLPIERVPFLRRLGGDVPDWVTQDLYYSALDDIEYAKRRVRGAETAGDAVGAREARRDERPVLALEERAKRVKKRVQALSEQIRAARNAGDDQRARALQESRASAMKPLVRAWKEALDPNR